jgi:ATP/maltotriose-dependent transcriptional regulator MalT
MANKLPYQFQNHALSLIDSLLPVSKAVFFLVDPDMQHRGVAMLNGEPKMEKQYTGEYASLDPLNPSRYHQSDVRVVTLDSQIAPHLLKQTQYYQEFMLANQHRYVADVFLRNQGCIVAILSLLRTQEQQDFTDKELRLLNKIQPFIEYSLNAVYLPQRLNERNNFQRNYQFTERELDVLELLVHGASNKQIAADLNLGLATIKTHLNHIFSKAKVKSRAQLLSHMLQD